jgi:hypothetical protein
MAVAAKPLGRIRVFYRCLAGARNQFDITAAQTDIVQLAIRKTAQRVLGHTRIIPGCNGRPDFRANTERARPAVHAVRVNRRHNFHLEIIARSSGASLMHKHIDRAIVKNHVQTGIPAMQQLHKQSVCLDFCDAGADSSCPARNSPAESSCRDGKLRKIPEIS